MSKVSDIRTVSEVWPTRSTDRNKEHKSKNLPTPTPNPPHEEEDDGNQTNDKPVPHIDEYI